MNLIPWLYLTFMVTVLTVFYIKVRSDTIRNDTVRSDTNRNNTIKNNKGEIKNEH